MCGSSLRKFCPCLFDGTKLANSSISGIPHSIQALDAGVEFMLVFDQGDFSEDNTFLASEVFLRSPVRLNPLYS